MGVGQSWRVIRIQAIPTLVMPNHEPAASDVVFLGAGPPVFFDLNRDTFLSVQKLKSEWFHGFPFKSGEGSKDGSRPGSSKADD